MWPGPAHAKCSPPLLPEVAAALPAHRAGTRVARLKTAPRGGPVRFLLAWDCPRLRSARRGRQNDAVTGRAEPARARTHSDDPLRNGPGWRPTLHPNSTPAAAPEGPVPASISLSRDFR